MYADVPDHGTAWNYGAHFLLQLDVTYLLGYIKHPSHTTFGFSTLIVIRGEVNDQSDCFFDYHDGARSLFNWCIVFQTRIRSHAVEVMYRDISARRIQTATDRGTETSYFNMIKDDVE